MGSRLHVLARRSRPGAFGPSGAPPLSPDAARRARLRPGPGEVPDPDAEFVGGAWDEAGPPTLDFDDEAAWRSLGEREPGEDFATMEARAPRPDTDAAELLDRVGADLEGADPGDADDAWDEAAATWSDDWGAPGRPRPWPSLGRGRDDA